MENNQISEPVDFLKGLGIFLFGVLIDQITKYGAENIFRNYNFAFSLVVPKLVMYAVYFSILSCILIFLFWHYRKLLKIEVIAWAFILAGAVSNVGERVILGFVKDWIYIGNGIFNIADGYILVGIIILLVKSKSSNYSNF